MTARLMRKVGRIPAVLVQRGEQTMSFDPARPSEVVPASVHGVVQIMIPEYRPGENHQVAAHLQWAGPDGSGRVATVRCQPGVDVLMAEGVVPLEADTLQLLPARVSPAAVPADILRVHLRQKGPREQGVWLLAALLRRLPPVVQSFGRRVWAKIRLRVTRAQPWGWREATQLTKDDRVAMQREAQTAQWASRIRLTVVIDAEDPACSAVVTTRASIEAQAVAGLEVVVANLARWAADQPKGSAEPERWVAVLRPGAELAPSASYWLLRAIARAVAPAITPEVVFSDEQRAGRWSSHQGLVLSGAFDPERFRADRLLPGLVACRFSRVEHGLAHGESWCEAVAAAVDELSPTAVAHVNQVLVRWPVGQQPERPAPVADQGIDEPPWPRVSIVIPTRDRMDLLGVCVNSLRERTDYPAWDICIADNDSAEPATHQFFDTLRAQGHHVVPCPGEFNFSRIVNTAVARTSADIVVLLNNDVEITEPGWLTALVRHARRPEIGCVGAKLYYPDGRIQHAGVTIGLGNLAGHLMRFFQGDSPGYRDQLRYLRSVRAVTAACFAVRREIWDAVQGFDEAHLPVAYNDVDFCLRVEERGYRNLWTPHASLIHHEYASRGLDLDPVRRARYESECAYMKARWNTEAHVDPYYHPGLTRADESSELASDPWRPRPWRAHDLGRCSEGESL